VKNMQDDGISEEDINRIRSVFDEDYIAETAPAAVEAPASPSGDNSSGLQAALEEMERNVISKVEKMILEREARIIAAISGAGTLQPARAAAAKAAKAQPGPRSQSCGSSSGCGSGSGSEASHST